MRKHIRFDGDDSDGESKALLKPKVKKKKKKRRHESSAVATESPTSIKKQKVASSTSEGAALQVQSSIKNEPTSPKREAKASALKPPPISPSFVPRSVKVEHVVKLELPKPKPSQVKAPPQPKAPQKSAKQQAPKAKKPAIPKNGNYSSYYSAGYRSEDGRLQMLRREWFEGKRVLDIGCHCGEFSMRIARKFGCSVLFGVDIDSALIGEARTRLDQEKASTLGAGVKLPETTFLCTDFISRYKVLRKFDVVTCFSVTKWIHYNFADEGIRILFRKVADSLEPGGLFIMEPQNWKSYKKKCRTSPKIFKNFKSIQMRPTEFRKCLQEEFGFEFVCEVRGDKKKATFKGRPIVVFRKSDASSIKEEKASVKTESSSRSVKLENGSMLDVASTIPATRDRGSVKEEKGVSSSTSTPVSMKKEDCGTPVLSSVSSGDRADTAPTCNRKLNGACDGDIESPLSEPSNALNTGSRDAGNSRDQTKLSKPEKGKLSRPSATNGSSHRTEKKRKRGKPSPKVNGIKRAKKSDGSKMPKLEIC